MPAHTRVDVCIVGGGPAGCVAARLLADWGWSALLLDRRPTAPPLAESLPPSTRKLLALVGLEQDVDAAQLFPNTGNSARWAGRDRHVESPDAGYHVSRGEWDALLLESARRAGVRVLDAVVRHVDVDRPCVHAVDRAAVALTIDCEYVLDCSGRAGVIARRGLRRRPASHRTLAIAAEWRTPGWPVGERTHTFVESYEDGWCWSVPLAHDRRQCTVMIDPERVALRRGRPLSRSALQDAYEREIAKTGAIAARLGDARLASRAWACDASLYDCHRAAEGRALLVGDAASFIEPLSSAGVKKAMLSAWRAAIVVNTCLKSDARRAAAFDYHTDREREVWRASSRQAAVFFAEAATVHGGGFWTSRASLDAGDGPEPIDVARLDGGAIGAAFERLRSNAAARLVVSPRLERAAAPAIEGREIVLRDGLRLPGLARPVRFVSNVDLSALVDIVSSHDDVASAMDAYRERIDAVDRSDLLRGLSLLVACRAIHHEGIHS